MFKQSLKLEVKKNERNYVLLLPDNCTLGELVDVLFDMRTFGMNAIQEVIEKEKPKEEPKIEEENKTG